VPIVPFVLLNGTEGIGPGWSTFVPPFHPADVVANVRRCLAGEPLAPMQPWFRGFKVWHKHNTSYAIARRAKSITTSPV